MRASFAAELLKVGRRPAMWLVAVVWLALSLVFGYLFPYLLLVARPLARPPAPAQPPPSRSWPRRCRPTWSPPRSRASRCLPVRWRCCLACCRPAANTAGAREDDPGPGPGRLAVLAGKPALGLRCCWWCWRPSR